jgi:hypothetical protein
MLAYMPVIPATRKTEVGGSKSEPSPGKRWETLSEEQTKAKWLKWWSDFLQVQSPELKPQCHQ